MVQTRQYKVLSILGQGGFGTVYIAGQAMTTDYPSSFEEKSMIKMVGYDMAKNAAQKVYEQTGIGPQDV